MSLIRDLADQIIQAHQNDDLCIPIPPFSMSSPSPQIDNEAAADHYELAGRPCSSGNGLYRSRCQGAW